MEELVQSSKEDGTSSSGLKECDTEDEPAVNESVRRKMSLDTNVSGRERVSSFYDAEGCVK